MLTHVMINHMSSTQKTVLFIFIGILAIGLMYAIARSLNEGSNGNSYSNDEYKNDAAVTTPSSSTPDASSSTSNPSSTSSMTNPSGKYTFQGALPADQITNKKVTISTDKGDIVMELYPEDAPKTVSNFVYLAAQKFYDGLTFHRYEPGFVIQGGDPSGNGTGGPGYKFEDEKVTKKYTRGIVAMANAGPDTNGSQFFIMLEDTGLPPQYTIFGKVISGMDVVDQIRAGNVMKTVTVSGK